MATRNERVVLDLEDRFTPGIARAAAAAKLFDKALNDLDGSTTQTTKDLEPLGSPNGPVANTEKRSYTARREIDRLSGRMRVLADVAAILGPGLVPIAAVGVPAVTALASQLGTVALAGGTAILAFRGVGDTLKAVNKAALEPTTENLEAARVAMQQLGPEAQSFVRELRQLQPTFLGIRNAAAAGLFPGLEKSLGELDALAPRLEDMALVIGDALGDVAAKSADSLTGPRWRDFIEFLSAEAPQVLGQLARIVGDLAHGVAELWMAFDPLNDDFSTWMARGADAFDRWATGLSKTEGFQDFIAYIERSGPEVGHALASIANALLKIVEAAAPLGGPVLDALASIADVIAKIAGSDAGPTIMAAVTALALLRRGQAAFGAIAETSWAKGIKGAETYGGKIKAMRLGRGVAAGAGIALASSGLADQFGLANTASLALMGTLAGPWGAAVGGAVGLMLDYADSQNEFHDAAMAVADTLNQQTGAITDNTREWVKNELYTSGAYEAAERLGIGLDLFTDAALGNSEALGTVNGELDRFISSTTGENARALAGDSGMRQVNEDATTLKTTLNGTNGVIDEGRTKIRQFGEAGSGAGGRAADGFDQARSAAVQFRAEIERVNRLLSDRASWRDYQASIDDFTDSLDEIKHKGKLLNDDRTKINIDLPKGREIQERLDGIASTALKVAQNLKGANRERFLERARRDFIKAATDLHMTEAAAKALADKLLDLDRTDAKPKVDVDTSRAMAEIGNVHRALSGIHDESVYVDIWTRRHTPKEAAGFYASGGYTGRGHKYEPAGIVHRDEYVFSSEATRGNVAMLDRLHRQLRGYADGGLVSAAHRAGPSQMGSVQVIERTVETLPRGAVVAHIQGFGEAALHFVDDRYQANVAADLHNQGARPRRG